MKILGIDSSAMVASVAIVDDDILIAEYSINHKKTHSQTLLPMLDEIVKMAEQDLSEIDAIAIAAGPGSFTGLRIGSATAKGLGMALGKPIISVPTCQALAYNLAGADALICPIMDARRNQVYTGIYDVSLISGEESKNGNNENGEDAGNVGGADNCENVENGRTAGNCEDSGNDGEKSVNGLSVILPQTAMQIDELIDLINDMDKAVIFTGDGIPVYKKILEEKLTAKHSFAPPHINRQKAGAVAALGKIYLENGIYESANDHKPVYLRKPQAERELEEKRNAQNGK